MRIRLLLVCLSLASLGLDAQTAAGQAEKATATAAPAPRVGSSSMPSVLPDLDKLQAAASQAATDIGYLRIEKWKADGESKRQAQNNADSVQRNLTSALPGLIEAVRAAPQDVNAEFKLYRNLNALYDVFGSLTESTGAFGPKSDYEALAQQLQVIASVRRDLGDTLEGLTASTQSELTQLRSQVRAQQQSMAAAAAAAPPRKILVDDTQPSPKTVHKKKKPAASGSTSGPDAQGANSGNSAPNIPKP